MLEGDCFGAFGGTNKDRTEKRGYLRQKSKGNRGILEKFQGFWVLGRGKDNRE